MKQIGKEWLKYMNKVYQVEQRPSTPNVPATPTGITATSKNVGTFTKSPAKLLDGLPSARHLVAVFIEAVSK